MNDRRPSLDIARTQSVTLGTYRSVGSWATAEARSESRRYASRGRKVSWCSSAWRGLRQAGRTDRTWGEWGRRGYNSVLARYRTGPCTLCHISLGWKQNATAEDTSSGSRRYTSRGGSHRVRVFLACSSRAAPIQLHSVRRSGELEWRSNLRRRQLRRRPGLWRTCAGC